MDGVTILQTITYTPITHFIIFGAILCLAMMAVIVTAGDILTDGVVLVVFIALVLGVCLISIGVCGYDSPTYKVTISDTVSYNEFTAKYDIVKTEGKIITVRLKDTSTENNKTKESKEDE